MAQKLAHDLTAHGYDIWIAPDSIRPGEKWVEAISRGLEESSIFVLLLSPEAVASRWVQMETNAAITYTHEDEMMLYPIMLKPCHLPALWRAYQHIFLQAGYKQGVNQLPAALNPLGTDATRTIVENLSHTLLEVSDPYTSYELGLEKLRAMVGNVLELLVYEQQLRENISRTRQYGDTAELSSRRSEIIEKLNDFSLKEINQTFNDLCQMGHTKNG